MTDTTDLFERQRSADLFRAALGAVGQQLAWRAELDDLLEQAASNLWLPERLGVYIAGRLPLGAGAGLVVLKMRALAVAPEPAEPNPHAAGARASSGRWRQPKRPCGECDGSPARWLEITPEGHRGQTQVMHCPNCWVAPPGYLPPRRWDA